MKLTREQIMAEPAGRQMDAWVAEFVMGWLPGSISQLYDNPDLDVWRIGEGKEFKVCAYKSLWSPSTYMDAAWMVVEKLNNMQMPEHLGPTRIHKLSNCDNRWHVIFCSDFGYPPGDEVIAESAPLAICKAALLALLNL